MSVKGEHVQFYSDHLREDFDYNVYGQGKIPIIAFPTHGGRYYDFENFGMVGSIQTLIEDGLITLFTVDSRDKQSWWDEDKTPEERAKRHIEYEYCIVKEVIPQIRKTCSLDEQAPIIVVGVNWGAYHASNLYFKYPEIFSDAICLSGQYSLNALIGEYWNLDIYYNDPLRFLPNLEDPEILSKLDANNLVLCVGQGKWENRYLFSARQLSHVLDKKGIPYHLDIWGYDVSHDWVWWRKQLPHLLGNLGLEVRLQQLLTSGLVITDE